MYRYPLLGAVCLCFGLLMACDKDKAADTPVAEQTTKAQPIEPASSAAQTRPPAALDAAMTTAHLERLATKLGCPLSADAEDARWCEVAKGWPQAKYADLPEGDELVLLGLTRWIATEGELDLADLYPATMALRRAEGTTYGDVVRIKNRSEVNAHHINGMIVQLKRAWAGKSKEVILTEKELYSYVARRAEKAEKPMAAHNQGWQLAGGNRFDVRKVGAYWVAVWQPKQKPNEPAGVHVAILEQLPFTDKPSTLVDVDIERVISGLPCRNGRFMRDSPTAYMCNIANGFASATELKKPEADSATFIGQAWSEGDAGDQVQAIGLKLAVAEDGRIATSLTYKSAALDPKDKKPANSKPDPSAPKALGDQIFEALKAMTPAEPARKAGEVSKVVVHPDLWPTHPGTKTYNYLRQSGDTIYMISHDPMGGHMWYAQLMKR